MKLLGVNIVKNNELVEENQKYLQYVVLMTSIFWKCNLPSLKIPIFMFFSGISTCKII